MSDSFDDLEELLMGETRKRYSAKVIDYAMNPRNLGVMGNPDGYSAGIVGHCGDTLEIWIKVDNGKIVEARFMTDGCGNIIACGSVITELATGKDVREALAISQQDVLDALDDLPEEDRHCAVSASNTLKSAVRDYLDIKKEPWKKAYRKI